jgi:benzil reductase ((S)-benzoin forming)
MRKVYIITGANRGLGMAIADTILQNENGVVISVSRTVNEKQKALDNTDSFHFLQTDFLETRLSTDLSELLVLIKNEDHIVFINNAAGIKPIERVGHFEVGAICDLIRINITAPIIISNFLLEKFREFNLDFVNITTGAANYPIENWALYSSSKACIKSFFSVAELENRGSKNIRFFNIDPGVLDTSMQNIIRDSNFPGREKFEEFKSKKILIDPFDAAATILKQINENCSNL